MTRTTIALLILVLSGCSTMQYTPNPKDSDPHGVQVLYDYPRGQFRNLGVIDFDFYRPGFREPTVTDALPELKQKVREAGGNAFIVRNQKIGRRNNRYITISAEVLYIEPRGKAGALPEPKYPLINMIGATTAPKGISDARAGAVTVFAGLGHGSGFIISPSGYVITNEHVVREARFVKVRLANGRDILGDVVRTDPARDVALIKVAESNLPAMTLNLTTAPNVGDEVYAIGTPFEEKLDVTVSRGIVSAYRDIGGLKYIQSDVQIHPGNSGGPLVDKDGRVVGISVSGIREGDVSQNLNFFIPIT